MVKKGFSFRSDRSGTLLRVLEGAEETGGKGWLLELTCDPGKPPAIPEHFHTNWTETFEVLSGRARYSLQGTEGTLEPGQSFTVLPGQKHVHPWNDGAETLVYRQRDQFGAADFEALHDVIGAFATTAGLQSEGKCGPDGRPKNPLQLAATLRTLVRHGGYDASVPAARQDAVAKSLGALAELFGFRGVYPRFVGE